MVMVRYNGIRRCDSRLAHVTCPPPYSAKDFFWAMSELIDSAKEAVFILDWWLVRHEMSRTLFGC